MTIISQIPAEYKLAKAMEALDALVAMVGADHSIRKTEAWVVANHNLAVLKGDETMPEFWASGSVTSPETFTVWQECTDDQKADYGAERKYVSEHNDVDEARKWRNATRLRLGNSWAVYITDDRDQIVRG